MELWIRSQGKRKLVKIDNVLLKGTDTRFVITNYKYSNITDEYYFVLGEYKSTERALEVLDEIHQRLIDLQTLEYLQGTITDVRWAKNRNISCVYEMPKE